MQFGSEFQFLRFSALVSIPTLAVCHLRRRNAVIKITAESDRQRAVLTIGPVTAAHYFRDLTSGSIPGLMWDCGPEVKRNAQRLTTQSTQPIKRIVAGEVE